MHLSTPSSQLTLVRHVVAFSEWQFSGKTDCLRMPSDEAEPEALPLFSQINVVVAVTLRLSMMLLAVVSLFRPPCACLQSEDVILRAGVAGVYTTWGALEGASLRGSLSVTTPAPSPAVLPPGGAWAWILLADDDEFDSISDLSDDQLCGGIDLTQMTAAAQRVGFPGSNSSGTSPDAVATTWAFNGVAGSDSFYYLVFVSCTNIDLTFATSYHFVNPGGEELSSGEIPYKPLSAAFLITWSVLLVLMVANLAFACACWRPRAPGLAGPLDTDVAPLPPVRRLHGLLLEVPLMALLNNAVIRAYFLGASATGEYDTGMHLAATVAGELESAALMAVILLLSRGWQLTRLTLDTNEKRHVAFLFVFYLTCLTCFTLIGGLFFSFLLVSAADAPPAPRP